METKESIIESLQPLFWEATQKGLWFHCNYQDMWFSPKELRAAQAKGNFVWGPVNWTLKPPQALKMQLQTNVSNAQAGLTSFIERLGHCGEEF